MSVYTLGSLTIGIVILPVLFGLGKHLNLYTTVKECESHVYTLFGKVIGTISDPGLQFPVASFGVNALMLVLFGKRYVVSTALRQNYLRNQMVNSEEGTPMGVGIWYEMKVSNPVSYLFENTNPDGSLEANVASSTVSTLSNLEMETMLENRHSLSRTVRTAVSPLSEKWGYRLGSVYIRKVAFTDLHMVQNITEKVVKRLVQVTSAMKQDGDNRVGLIKSETAKKVSQKLAEAAATRPQIVGRTLNEIARRDPEILETVLQVLEASKMIESQTPVSVVPRGVAILAALEVGGARRISREPNS